MATEIVQINTKIWILEYIKKVFDLNLFFVSVVALRPKSTAIVMAGQSVHLTTLFFLGKLTQAVDQYFVHILSLVTDNNPS